MHDLTYNGKTLSSLGFTIIGKPFYTAAKRNFSLNSISGFSNAAIIDNGSYENVQVTYMINSVFNTNSYSCQEKAYELIDWLTSFNGEYFELRDTYNEGYYTKAICTNVSQIETTFGRYLNTTIEFSRIPFWYSDKGRNKIICNENIVKLINSEKISSYPLLKIFPHTKNVPFVLTINNIKYEFFNGCPLEYMDIDCDKQTAFNGAVSLDRFVTLDYFPYFISGENTIELTSNVDKIEIIPRWRRL